MDDNLKKDYTKISIQKSLHKIVKKICNTKGIKMYHFLDDIVIDYLKNNYPKYMENGVKSE